MPAQGDPGAFLAIAHRCGAAGNPANFVPSHMQFGELTFLKTLREYRVRSAALQARQYAPGTSGAALKRRKILRPCVLCVSGRQNPGHSRFRGDQQTTVIKRVSAPVMTA